MFIKENLSRLIIKDYWQSIRPQYWILIFTVDFLNLISDLFFNLHNFGASLLFVPVTARNIHRFRNFLLKVHICFTLYRKFHILQSTQPYIFVPLHFLPLLREHQRLLDQLLNVCGLLLDHFQGIVKLFRLFDKLVLKITRVNCL